MIVKVKSKEELIKLGCELLSREFYCGKEIEVEKDCITDDYYGKGWYWNKNWLIFPKKKKETKHDYKKKLEVLLEELKEWILGNEIYDNKSKLFKGVVNIRELVNKIEALERDVKE